MPDSPLRVCHVVGSLDPSMGGLPKSVVAMACAQTTAGAETAVLYTGGKDPEPSISDAYGALPGFDQVTFHRINSSRIERWRATRSLTAMRNVQPDLIQTHGLWEPLLHRAHQDAEAGDIPFGLTPHSMLHPWQAGHKRIPKWLVTRGLGWRRAWNRAAFVQALTESEAEILRKTGFNNIDVIPNGIFPEEDVGDRGLELDGWHGEPFVLFLSRLHPQKAPELLMEAFAGLARVYPEHRLVLAGPDFGLEPGLRRMANRHGLTDRVLFPGELKGERKWAALHRTACFCLPSRAEGFSLALLEAALAGAPVAISDQCGFPELEEAGGALTFGVDAESLAQRLKEVLDDPIAAGKMGGTARRVVLDRYTWDQVAERHLSLYRRVLGEGS